MRQYAWLELHKGLWYLLTDVRAGPLEASRKWMEKERALTELAAEGWEISGPYPEDLGVAQKVERGFMGTRWSAVVH